MAGSASYTAVLDACVLYPAPVRDLLLSLAKVGLYHARWSDAIHDEWIRNVLAKRSDLDEQKLRRTVELMNAAILDSRVEGYESLIASLDLPDQDDRHVLAVAIVGHADAIVTYNLRDFPAEKLRPFNLERSTRMISSPTSSTCTSSPQSPP